MKSLKQEYFIKSTPKKVWEALTSPGIIKKWGAGPAKMKPLKNFEFSLWDGDIHGKNTEVVAEKVLKQDWMAGKWDIYSKVEFKLKQEKDGTKITLVHNNIPDREFKDIEEGWNLYYLGPLKKLLEDK